MNLEGMYQEIILDHYKHPRGSGALQAHDAEAFHVNPTCGDEITVQVQRSPEGAFHIGYVGQGCSISQASASVMAELLDGKSREEIDAAHQEFLALMHGKGAVDGDEELIGDGIAFTGVAKYPARIKCALLGWMALQDACEQAEGTPA